VARGWIGAEAAETWATVRVRRGCAVLEGLFMDGKSIEEIARASKKP
jgi:hypothetical protein